MEAGEFGEKQRKDNSGGEGRTVNGKETEDLIVLGEGCNDY